MRILLRMTFKEISAEIKSGKFKPLYLLHGEENYFIDEITDLLMKHVLTEEEKEFNMNVFYGLDSDTDTIVSVARKYPMMAQYNLVLVREAQHLRDIAKLESYVENPLQSTVLVLINRNKKADMRKKVFKAFGQKGVAFESKRLYDNQVPDWLMKHLVAAGYHISVRNAALITDFLGTDLAHINNELGKIILNLPQGSNITGEVIEEFIGIDKEYNTFELNNALGHRNIQKANRIAIYFGYNEKKYAIQPIIANLYSFFSKVIKNHYLTGMSGPEKAKVLGVHPYFVKDYDIAASKYPLPQLTKIIGILHEYDLKSKGVNNLSSSSGELIKELVYKILH